MAADLPAPSRCRLCPAQVRWALQVERYKKLPFEVTPSESGPWVLVQDQVLGLLAVPYDATKHAASFRYRSHLERCRPSAQRVEASRKPDQTAGMKFPKRKPQPNDRKVMPRFPPLDELMGVRRG